MPATDSKFVPAYVIIIACLLAMWLAVAALRRRRLTAQPPPLGIVLLLRQPRALDAATLGGIFGRVTGDVFEVVPPPSGRRVSPADIPEGSAVLGEPPSFLVKANGDLFLVNSVATPYVIQGEAPGGGMDKARLAGIMREQHAWISVEILHPEAVSSANYRIVGGAVAELLSAECLALLHPESRKVVPADAADSAGKLRAAHPLQAVFGVAPGLA
jgi:hypothetical protein